MAISVENTDEKVNPTDAIPADNRMLMLNMTDIEIAKENCKKKFFYRR